MKISKLIAVSFLLVLLCQAQMDHSELTDDPVQILEVSTDVQKFRSLAGSKRGGSSIYMRVTGLDQNPHNNKVKIGPHDCVIADKGVDGLQLSCETTDIGDSSDWWGQPIQIWVSGKRVSTCKAEKGCAFTYSNTPTLQNIIPRAVYPTVYSTWKGAFNTENKEDVVTMRIGDTICDRFNEEKREPDTWIYLYGGIINCQVSADIPAGYYAAKLKTLDGWTRSTYQVTSVRVDNGQTYDVLSAPYVKKLSTNSVSQAGGRITVEGHGFGTDASAVTATYAGVAARVVDLKPRSITVELPALPTTDLTSGFAKFAGPGGLRYTRYSITNQIDNCEKFRNAARTNSITAPILEDGFRTEPDSPDLYGPRFGQYYRGYIKAPRDGVYKLYVSSDDCAEVHLSSKPRGQFAYPVDMQHLASCSYTDYRNYWSFAYANPDVSPNAISRGVTLQKDQLYYIEIFHLNTWGDSSHLTVSLEAPSTSLQYNSLPKIQKVALSHAGRQERISFRIFNSAANSFPTGNFRIQFRKTQEGSQTFIVDKTCGDIPVSAHQDWAWGAFRWGCGWPMTLVRTPLNNLGQALPAGTTTGIAGYQFDITYPQHRGIANGVTPTIITSGLSGTVTSSVTHVQVADRPIYSGTFKLQFGADFLKVNINGRWTDLIPWDVDDWVLAYGVDQLFPRCESRVWSSNTKVDGRSYYFSCNGVYQHLPTIVVNSNTVLSGTTTSIVASVESELNYNQLFQPIPYEILQHAESSPQLSIRVNNIEAACDVGQCTLTPATNVPQVTAFTRSAATLTVTLSASTLTFDQFDIDIRFAGSQCSNYLIQAGSITCTLPTLNGNPVLEAGSYVPRVHLRQLGFLPVASTVTPQQVALTISSVTPNRGSLSGGQEITISGTGFPAALNVPGYTLRIGTADITITSINNRQIKAVMPAQQTGSITLTFNGLTATAAFTYDLALTVQLTSLSVTSASPYAKRSVVIAGNNFGTSRDQVKVFMRQQGGPNEYEMRVESITNTQLSVRLSGGRQGKYDIIVWRQGWGFSQPATAAANDLELGIKVFRINNRVLSTGGGTLITIEGQNFDTSPTNTIVALGNIANWFCEIVDITETQIRCTTPPQHSTFTGAVPVNVITRLQDYAQLQCAVTSDCQVTYSSAVTPQLNLPTRRILLEEEEVEEITRIEESRKIRFLFSEETKQPGPNHLINFFHPHRNLQQVDSTLPPLTTQFGYEPSKAYTLTGSGFGTNPILHIGSTKITTFSALSDTSLTFTFPTLASYGLHLMRLEVPGRGFSNNAWWGKVTLNAWTLDPPTISRGGETVILHGRGFTLTDPKWNTQFELIIPERNNEVFARLECTRIFEQWGSSRMVCVTPRIQDTSVTYKVRIVQTDPITLKQEGPFWFNRNLAFAADGPVVNTISGAFTGRGDLEFPFTVPNGASFSITITGANFPASPLVSFLNRQGRVIATATITSATATEIVAQFTNVQAGRNQLQVRFDTNAAQGYYRLAYFTNEYFQYIIVNMDRPNVVSQVQSSYLGGRTLQLTGSGFSTVPAENEVTVCGFPCPVTAATATTLSCTVPSFQTENTSGAYNLGREYDHIHKSLFDLTSDTRLNADSVYDNLQTSNYFSANPQCFLRFDFGENKLKLHQIRFMPKVENFVSTNLIGSKFQVSYNGIDFVDVHVINSLVRAGWNFFVPTSPIANIQALRFVDENGVSKCQLAEIQLYGWIQFQQNPTLAEGKLCSAKVRVLGSQHANALQAVQYTEALTPLVNEVTPPFGPTNGGTVITITGSRFAQPAQVLVDNVPCAITSLTATQIVCTTGNRQVAANASRRASFQVLINGNLAYVAKGFMYANRFSAEATWGGDIPPREGDSIVVPVGQTLLIDVTPPKLFAVIIEGQVLFEDARDLKFDATYVIVREGVFSIGSEEAPRQKRLEITLWGKITDKQLPAFGNKMIACHNCELNIHGRPRSPVWTELAVTAERGAKSILLTQEVDWQVGEEIVIASTGWNHLETERRFIETVSLDKRTITFRDPLRFRHYSAVETYGTKQFPMRAEVGLLSRNVVIQGDADSWKEEYGAHVMLHGKMSGGVRGRISYTQFREVGQPRIIGRYPIHFHMNGEMTDSYAIGNSIHDSYARCITIHGTHFLRVQNNVGFNAKGHGIFMEDGIETNNIITGNLILGSKQSWIMLQQDITVSTYWITNPYNTVRDNRSGGSEWYGFWYEIKANPDGPSATSDICPRGIQLQQFTNNIAHSNGKYGLRILELAARKFPCLPAMNELKEDNQFDENPAIWSTFENFATFSNGDAGVLGEELGNVRFTNMMVADSKYAGFQTHKTNITRDGAIIDNFLIVGKSQGNAQPDAWYNEARAIIAPRTDGFTARDIQIHNFASNMILFQSCSFCHHGKVKVTGGKNARFERVQIFNSDSAKRVFWESVRREIFHDADGSFTGSPAYLTPHKPHFNGLSECTAQLTEQWNNTVICSAASTQIRDVLINNPQPGSAFESSVMKIFRVGGAAADVTSEEMIKIKKSKDTPNSFSTALATGYVYNINWNSGMDFEHLAIQPSRLFTPEDKGIVLRFNYFAVRDNFKIGRLLGTKITQHYTNIGVQPNPENCRNGDWFNDKDNKFLYICVSGKGKKTYEYIDVDPIRCEGTGCAGGIKEETKETFKRFWSNAANWPNGVKPVAGSIVTIPGSWDLVLDESTPVLEELVVNGFLSFDDTKPNLNLQAKRIWVKAGKIFAGSQTTPYKNKATITLHGVKTDTNLLINEFIEASSKVLAVTNGLELWGSAPATVWTRLTAFADAGTNTLTVASTAGWKVGDQIAVGPSGRIPEQHERFTIVAINGNTVTLNSPLLYNHFGAPDVTINVAVGQLDMRAVVGHMTRNIKIVGAPDSTTNWGCRVLITQFKDTVVNGVRRGYANINGVEFENCGQIDSERAGLDFFFLNDIDARRQSNIENNSFHDSFGVLFSARSSHDVLVRNNFFYRGVRSLAVMFDGQNNKFLNNALVYVSKRGADTLGMTNWAALGNFVSETNFFTIDQIEVSNNVGQGSTDTGFIMMSVPCNLADQNAFINNVVSSVVLSGLVYRQTSRDCSLIKTGGAFHTKKGLMGSFNAYEIRIENVVLAENGVNAIVRPGNDDDYDNGNLQSKWYITALARPNCPKCYDASFGDVCKNQVGFQMGAVTSMAFPPPLTKPSDQVNLICTLQRIDGRVYLDQVTFDSFRTTYTGFPNCGNNKVFRQDVLAADMTCANYLTRTTCQNCETSALFGFLNPDYNLRGWLGGCGTFDCTGPLNILVHDQDGSFLGTPQQVISNNQWFGPNTAGCTKINEWNGYRCATQSIGVLNWMSIAPDFNTRLFSPVYLKVNNVLINQINSLKEWEWDGPEPMNKRESKFTALVHLGQKIVMENAGKNPTDYHFWLQKRAYTGKADDFVVIRLTYFDPQSIQVLKVGDLRETIIHPYPVKYEVQNGVNVRVLEDLTQKRICGANNYISDTNTIEFVLTGEKDCLIRVRQVNNLVLNTHLNLNFDSFLSNDKFGSFVNKVAAFLDLDPARVKVVGVARGSTIPMAICDQTSAVGASNTPNGLYDPNIAKQQLDQLINKVTYKTQDLTVSLEDLRDDRDPPLTMQVTKLEGRVSQNVKPPSTEYPTRRLLANESIEIHSNDVLPQSSNSNIISFAAVIVFFLMAGLYVAKRRNENTKANEVVAEMVSQPTRV